MRRLMLTMIGALCLAAGSAGSADPPAWSPGPWLQDLDQARAAIDAKYANLDWLRQERELDLDALFRRAADRLRGARSDEEARRIFDRLVQRIADGHVGIRWPRPPAPAVAPSPVPTPRPQEPAELCRGLGYDAGQSSPGLAPALAGYRALTGDNVFPAGTIRVGERMVGVLRIGVFQPQGSPQACEEAVRSLQVPLDRPCEEACTDAILTAAYRRLTRDLADRLRQLREAGAAALLIDISGNGGGSEWAEAAARMVTSRRLVSERRGFVRGPHWAAQWRDLSARLRAAAATADPADRTRLLAWAAEAEAAQREAETPCPDPAAGCTRIAVAGFATGLVGSAPAGSLAGRAWAPYVFSPAQYDYRDGAWSGPLIVLVDQETWSAAEEFAAVLQDNRAAIILGARTGGAGCGHTYGGTPTTLSNSGATLELPDCVRFRRDGSNEVRGILPDLVVPIRASDGNRFKAAMIEAQLPQALVQAERLARTR